MKDIYTLEDVDYIEFQTSDYSIFRVERNIIKEFSLKLKYDKVDVSICSDNLIEDILLVDNMLLVVNVANIYPVDNFYYNDDYEGEMKSITQIDVHLEDEKVISAYVNMSNKDNNENQVNEYFDRNGENLLLISIEDK